MKKVAVILSGCGVYDGAEINESVLTLLALDKANAEVTCAAPNIKQHHVMNHFSGEECPNESRNVLFESARIARGNIKNLAEIKPESFDAVILPGGFGAAKNLSSFATQGASMTVDETVTEFLTKAQTLGKPLGFACIAPAIAAKLFGDKKIVFTIGNDPETAEPLGSFGGCHKDTPVEDVVIDKNLKIVTTPAYMLAERISQAERGISKLVDAVLALTY
ncbi:MAG: isoprenoid biosynthesis glyoxalase ElbB [Verrucomicrobiota bacterium]